MGVYAVTRDDDVAVAYIRNPPDRQGAAYRIFDALEKAGVDVKMILLTASARTPGVCGNVVFAIPRREEKRTADVLDRLYGHQPTPERYIDQQVARITVSGDEMLGKPATAVKIYHCLWAAGIPIIHVSSGELGVSMLVPTEEAEKAMDCLCREFPI